MSSGSTSPPVTTIHEATRIPGGVRKDNLLTLAQAAARRQTGLDIVVCGENTYANCNQAYAIESAVGPCYHDGPHDAGGLYALPHWQQRNPPPRGHSFYETHVRKALV